MSWEIKGFSGLFWDCVNTVNDKQGSGNSWPSWGENCIEVCTAKLVQETIWQQWHPAPVSCAGRHDGNRNPAHSPHMKWNTTGVCVEYLILSHCHPHSSHLVQDWSLKRIRRVESAVGILSSKYFTHNIINNSFFMNIINLTYKESSGSLIRKRVLHVLFFTW